MADKDGRNKEFARLTRFKSCDSLCAHHVADRSGLIESSRPGSVVIRRRVHKIKGHLRRVKYLYQSIAAASDGALEAYEYTDLKDPHAIRILTLAPGRDFGEIRCSLSQVLLTSRPKYEALSYAWGDPSKPRRVVCDGKAIPVTENLFTALRNLRWPDEERAIWVDGLCINQTSNVEKNHQLPLMGRVYSEARMVLIWLGEDKGNDGRTAFSYLKELGDHLREHTVHSLGSPLLQDNVRKYWLPRLNSVWRRLAGNPWFRRLWVVQEVALARNSMLVWGGETIALDLVLRIISVVSECQASITSEGLRPLKSLSRIDSIRTNTWAPQLKKGRKLSILDLLHQTEPFECTDPRDKIYALLGLVSTPGFTADYTLSVEQVFVGFSTWALAQFADLQVLSYARGVVKPSWDLPSWGVSPNPSSVLKKVVIGKKFHASTMSDQSIHASEARLWSVLSNNILQLQGHFIDTVLKVCMSVNLGGTKAPTTSKSAPMHLRIMLAEARRIAKCDAGREMDIPRYQRFCSSIIYEAISGTGKDIQWAYEVHKYLIREDAPAKTNKGEPKKRKAFRSVESHSPYGEPIDHKAWDNKFHNDLSRQILKLASGRRFCLTEEDRFAWVPLQAEAGDLICVIRGANVPFVLRPQTDGKFALVGECWIQGLMYGEALDVSDFNWAPIELI